MPLDNASNPYPDLSTPLVEARYLYWMGGSITAIAQHLKVSRSVIRAWKDRELWDQVDSSDRISGALEHRLIYLITKDPKTGSDFKEIDLLSRQVQRLARVDAYRASGKPSDLNPKLARPGQKGPRLRRNAFTDSQVAAVNDAFMSGLFGYQEAWRIAGEQHRIRNILKSRQIGATYYFAREALNDALRTGKNKIFCSASKAQASIFRTYIIQLAQEAADVDLVGDPIILSNNAELHFLGTNAKTAQGYHGDVYLDEYFWIMKFQEFRKVTSAMAMHKKWRQTYFSAPSAITHEAFQFWSGDLFNKRRAKSERQDFRTDHESLRHGLLCPDGQWRQIVTVEDAIAQGCNLFDIEQLRLEYSLDEFRNLLMCEFMDDTLSAFPLSLVHPCMVDSWDAWPDVHPFAPRPVGNAEVWIGYDPAGDGEGGDGAGLVVLLPPDTPAGPHRILERHRLRGQDYASQADFVLSFLSKYRVGHIGIDCTGIGDAVFKIVSAAFPTATRYQYHPVLKTNMVLQAQHIMRKGRMQFDAGATDLLQSFMAIRREQTPAGGAATFTAARNATTGHADLAWATMHALHFEPIQAPESAGAGQSFVVFGQ